MLMNEKPLAVLLPIPILAHQKSDIMNHYSVLLSLFSLDFSVHFLNRIMFLF